MGKNIFSVVFVMVMLAQLSLANPLSPQGIVLQGTILTGAGLPVESSSVVFSIQIHSSDPSHCLLYAESHTLNMSNSGGAFSLVIGSGSRFGGGFQATSSISQVFSNSPVLISGLNCAIGTSYTAASGDSRKVVITFDDGNGPQTLSQSLAINAVPYALYADRLEGKSSSDFIQVNGASASLTQGNLEAIFSNINFPILQEILAGTSTIYAKTSGNPEFTGNLTVAGNVGIGTTSPTSALSVVGGVDLLAQTTYGSRLQLNGGVQPSGGAILSGGNDNNGHIGASLTLQGGSNAGHGAAVFTGKVGIGTSSPQATLDVVGDVKVGNSSATCSNSTKGSIRFNNTTSSIEYCNASVWVQMNVAACSDATPDVFSFSDESNAAPSTLVTSSAVQITGINCTVPVSISGGGSPQFQICSDAGCTSVIQSWTSGSSSIVSGQYLQIRLTSETMGGGKFQATVIAGSAASVWSVTNTGGDCAGTPAVGTVCADGTIYAGLSPDGNIKMFTTRCDAGQTWDGIGSCTGTRSALTWDVGIGVEVLTSNVGVTTGKSNSAALAVLSNTRSPYVSAQYCETLSENGKTDWYLPASSELNVLFNNRNVIKNFVTSGSYYWTSTDNKSYAAYGQNFSTGYLDGERYKNYSQLVRCVRR